MTFARANPLGWALFEILTSAQMNQLDINMTLALDGGAGGSYTPTAKLAVDGISLVVPTDESLKVTSGLEGPAALFTNQVVMTNGSQPIMKIEGGGPRQFLGTGTAESLNVQGQVVSDSGGETAIVAKGGETTLATGSSMGVAINASGGTGASATSYNGGTAIISFGSQGIGPTPSTQGGHGISASGGFGDDFAEGGIGGRFTGGAANESTSLAGPGVEAKGNLANLSIPSPGGVFLMGGVEPVGFRTSMSAAIMAGASNSASEGRTIHAMYSGNALGGSANKFEVIGTPSFQLSVLELDYRATDVQGGGGAVNSLLEANYGTGENVRVLDGNAIGDVAALDINLAENATTQNGVHLNLEPIGAGALPTSYHQGGLVYLNAAVTDQEDTALFMASGVQGGGRSFYDRVVGSNDPAAVYAWSQIDTDGAGAAGVVGVGNNGSYNILTIAIVSNFVQITLKQGCGADFNCPQVTLDTDSLVAGVTSAFCDSAGTGVFNVTFANAAGAVVSAATAALKFNFSVTGAVPVSTLTNATRPTKTAVYP